MQTGANLPAVGGYNQTVVLDAVRRSPDGVSRVELAERTGLSAQTVSNVTRRLLVDGLIVDAGTVVAGVGKPRTILRLQPHGRFAVGVHLDPTVITVVLLDLASQVVAHRTIATPESGRAPQTIKRIQEGVDAVIRTAGIDATRVMGVGIAAPGPIDASSGTVLNPPLLSGWEHVAVRRELASALDMPVLLEKDVTAAAVAEVWAGRAPGRANMAFFYYGTGVGAGLVLQNEVIRGVSSNAGDIGYLIVRDAAGGGADRPGGTETRLGNSVLPKRLVGEAIRLGVLPEPGHPLGTEGVREQFGALAAAAVSGDPIATRLLDAVATDMAAGLVQLVNLLDIDRVVFGGPFFGPVAEFMLERIPLRVLESAELVVPHPVSFVVSGFGEDVAAIGAACLVLDHAFSPRPAGLLIAR
jgi:Transcriptional regulator/sugar kinase